MHPRYLSTKIRRALTIWVSELAIESVWPLLALRLGFSGAKRNAKVIAEGSERYTPALPLLALIHERRGRRILRTSHKCRSANFALWVFSEVRLHERA